MPDSLSEYYRLPAELERGVVGPESNGGTQGFFRFGQAITCYGSCHAGVAEHVGDSVYFDASKGIQIEGSTIRLPFSFDEVVANLRQERYEKRLVPSREKIVNKEWVRKAYYFVRELLPVRVRRHLQRLYFSDWRNRVFPAWPVDFSVDALHEEILRLWMRATGVASVPFIWFWPDGALSSLVITHDVETETGRDFTSALMDLDAAYGFRASFQVIPEKRYEVPDEYVREIRNRGFEFNIHDLNHDGHLYREREEFLRRAKRINSYVRKYNARGFRAGAMYRNQDWYDVFEFSYDMSVPNVAHLEPMRGGCCTVMPYFVGKIVELPLTAAQDYSLFHILTDYSIDLWQQQLALIRGKNGLMSFIAHPDYLIERRARNVYESLLNYLREMVAHESVWAALPGDVDRWWRARSQMKLIRRDGDWRIEGSGSERARVAYANIEGDRIVYSVDGGTSRTAS